MDCYDNYKEIELTEHISEVFRYTIYSFLYVYKALCLDLTRTHKKRE